MKKEKGSQKNKSELIRDFLNDEGLQRELIREIRDKPDKTENLRQALFSLQIQNQHQTVINNSLPIEDIEKLHNIDPKYVDFYHEELKKQTEHRIYLEKKAINGQENRASSGLHYGFILSALSIIASI